MSDEWLPPRAPGAPPPGAEAPEHPQQQQQQQPAPGYPSQPGYAPPRTYPPQPPNNDAVAGFTCGIVGATLLFFTGGLSTIVSLILGAIAIPYSSKGKRNVAEGRTSKHRDLAKAGYVIGIITVVLSVIATIVWILIFSLVDWGSLDDPNDNPFDDDEFQFQQALRAAGACIRLLG